MKQLIVILLVFLFGCNNAPLLNEFEPEVQKQLKEKFLDNAGNTTRFRNNILVYINKDIAPEDSAFIANLTEEINGLIENYIVSLTPEMPTASMIFYTDNNIPDGKIVRRKNVSSLIQSHIALNLNRPLEAIDREKMLYYYYIRALTEFKENYKTPEYPIQGFVFDEKNHQNITFHPLDKKVIKAIYSKTFDSQKRNSKKDITTSTLTYIQSILCFLLFVILFQKGFFKKHHYRFWPFFAQGFIVIIVLLITPLFMYSISYSDHIRLFLSRSLSDFGQLILTIPIIYAIERSLLKDKDNNLLRIVIPLFSTFASLLFVRLVLKLPIALSNDYSIIYIFLCIRCFYIYISILSENQIKKKDLELARLGELHKQAELRSLQAKINPHFLYNSLNSIASLASSDSMKTEKMALALSDFFKYSLNKEQKEMVSLKEEIESIETYLSIEKVRFGDRLNYSIFLPKELEDLEIPQFIIQPVVENAMKHGISHRISDGVIKIDISKNANHLEIRIFDNGPDFSEEPISGYGIQSIQEKLQLIYREKAYLKWENGTNKHILIVLPVK